MENNDNTNNSIYELAEEGLRFFGRMSASTTHEIKNTLAIINENIGLMDDLAMMAQDGTLSCESVSSISTNIKKQIQRSNNILQKFNKFSHSVDRSTQMIDLEKTVRFTMEIASRLIDMHEVKVQIIPAQFSSGLKINQFFLENIIWKAIDISCHRAKQSKNITISFEKNSVTQSIWFSLGQIEHDFLDNIFISNEDKILIKYLNMAIEKNRADNSFGLVWPDKT